MSFTFKSSLRSFIMASILVAVASGASASTFPDDCTNPQLMSEARKQLKAEYPSLTALDIENLAGQRAVAILDAQFGRNFEEAAFPDNANGARLMAYARAQLRAEYPSLTEVDIENLAGQRAVSILNNQFGRKSDAHTG